MIQKDTLWSRLGSWINPFYQDDGTPELARSSASSIPTASNGNGRLGTKVSGLLPRRGQDQTVQQLRHGYDKVLDLVESIQNHLDQQNKRSDRVVELLADLGQGMKEMPAAASRHTDTLKGLVNQIELANRHAQAMVSALGDWPNAAMAQRDALNAIALHLGSSSDTNTKLAEQLQAHNRTANMLAESSREQVATLKAMQESSHVCNNHLAHLIHTQTRRFTMLFVITLVLTLSAVAAVGVNLLF